MRTIYTEIKDDWRTVAETVVIAMTLKVSVNRTQQTTPQQWSELMWGDAGDQLSRGTGTDTAHLHTMLRIYNTHKCITLPANIIQIVTGIEVNSESYFPKLREYCPSVEGMTLYK